MKSMEVLVLANCALMTHRHDSTLAAHVENLSVLDISGNELHDNIAPWFGSLTEQSLYSVDLSNNSFTGELHESFTRLRV